jgi:hypothetical protein
MTRSVRQAPAIGTEVVVATHNRGDHHRSRRNCTTGAAGATTTGDGATTTGGTSGSTRRGTDGIIRKTIFFLYEGWEPAKWSFDRPHSAAARALHREARAAGRRFNSGTSSLRSN